MIRKPVVAGHFYPQDKTKLQEMITSFLPQKPSSGLCCAKGIILPHAGYQYSGRVAAKTISSCKLKNRLIILGPNHTGLGEPFSIMTEGYWKTPLSDVVIDSPLATKIAERSEYLKNDFLAHHSEHCIEVLLPFLQFINQDINIVPIVLSRADKKTYEEIATDILSSIKDLGVQEEVSIVASSDMTHYEPHESAEKKDRYAMEPIMELNADEFFKRVTSAHITMCGMAAVFILLKIVKGLGARRADLIKYQTSGDMTGDFSSVVGYAGIRIS